MQWGKHQWRMMPSIVPVILVRFVIVPLVVLYFAKAIGLTGDLHTAVVMESAMPSMVLGIVLCDHFKLDVNLYATAVTVTTAVSMIALPVWFHLLSVW